MIAVFTAWVLCFCAGLALGVFARIMRDHVIPRTEERG